MAWPLAPLTLLVGQEAKAPATAKPAATAAPVAKAGTKTAPGAAQPAPAENPLGMFVYLGPIFLLFYFMILRPQQQQDKKRKQMIEAVKKNDKVLTGAGIYGTVVSVDPTSDKIVVRIDDDKNVRVTFSKASITRVETASEKAGDQA